MECSILGEVVVTRFLYLLAARRQGIHIQSSASPKGALATGTHHLVNDMLISSLQLVKLIQLRHGHTWEVYSVYKILDYTLTCSKNGIY